MVTCLDSGGPAELVKDGVNGWVVAPRPDTLAAALRAATDNLPMAKQLGEAGLEQASHMTWTQAVTRLLAP